jgi:hypothetical protein
VARLSRGRGLLDDRYGLGQAGHALPARPGLGQWGADDLLENPQLLMITAE